MTPVVLVLIVKLFTLIGVKLHFLKKNETFTSLFNFELKFTITSNACSDESAT